jgi:cytidylate kinase
VIEGRDIGTAVFPDAQVKIFLTASPDIRARRRHAEVVGQTYDEILRDLLRRDELDSARAHSPLTPAPDATTIDTSDRSVDSVVAMMLDLCLAAGAADSGHCKVNG